MKIWDADGRWRPFFSLHLQFRKEMENMKIELAFVFCLCRQRGSEFCLHEEEGTRLKSLRTLTLSSVNVRLRLGIPGFKLLALIILNNLYQVK